MRNKMSSGSFVNEKVTIAAFPCYVLVSVCHFVGRFKLASLLISVRPTALSSSSAELAVGVDDERLFRSDGGRKRR